MGVSLCASETDCRWFDFYHESLLGSPHNRLIAQNFEGLIDFRSALSVRLARLGQEAAR